MIGAKVVAAVAASMALATAGVGAAAAQLTQTGAQAQENEEEIVVTARRSGIPVWRVRGPSGSIVLVGAIEGITKDTKWDPASLEQAVLKADRVMFPQTQEASISPFAMLGYLAKWRKQSKLKGRTLASMLAPGQLARLEALRVRGDLDAGYERKHPLHLALMLRGRATRGLGEGADPESVVRRIARKHKIQIAPIVRSKAKPLARDLFRAPPERHLPCLAAAIAMAEAGPEAVRARSHAWAQRKVPAVLASPADEVYARCWPQDLPAEVALRPDLKAGMRALLADPRVTLAVVDLRTLAERGGILDDLEAAGFDIQGPAWKAQR